MSKFVITLVVFSLYSMSFASTPPIRQELGNNWQFRQYHIGKWLPAEVPGTVHTDLINNGIIEDPFYRDNEKHIQWIDKADWEYELRFQVDEQLAGQKQTARISGIRHLVRHHPERSASSIHQQYVQDLESRCLRPAFR